MIAAMRLGRDISGKSGMKIGEMCHLTSHSSHLIPDDGNPVRLIVTPSLQGINMAPQAKAAAGIGVVQSVTNSGFRLWARNGVQCRNGDGIAGFNWLVIKETPEITANRPNGPFDLWDLYMGQIGALSFEAEGDEDGGDWRRFSEDMPPFSDPRETHPTILLTASSYGVRRHNAAAVAMVWSSSEGKIKMRARNSDCAAGDCGFNYAVAMTQQPKMGCRGRLLPTRGTPPGIWDRIIDTGHFSVPVLEKDGSSYTDETTGLEVSKDWATVTVPFNRLGSYLNPFDADNEPFVLVSPHRVSGAGPATVGIVQEVYPCVPGSGAGRINGFTVAVRNADCMSGTPEFDWVAIGPPPKGAVRPEFTSLTIEERKPAK